MDVAVPLYLSMYQDDLDFDELGKGMLIEMEETLDKYSDHLTAMQYPNVPARTYLINYFKKSLDIESIISNYLTIIK